MKVYKISPDGGNACTEKDVKMIIPWLEEAQPGDVFKITVSEMSESEYDLLPEYMGP